MCTHVDMQGWYKCGCQKRTLDPRNVELRAYVNQTLGRVITQQLLSTTERLCNPDDATFKILHKVLHFDNILDGPRRHTQQEHCADTVYGHLLPVRTGMDFVN